MSPLVLSVPCILEILEIQLTQYTTTKKADASDKKRGENDALV
jgi:hypothetical protein